MHPTHRRAGDRLKTVFVLLCVLSFGRLIAADNTPAKPKIYIVSDSTARNSGPGKNGQPLAGWGAPLADYFDPAKVTVFNVSHAGQSSRTYFNDPEDWPSVVGTISAGDFVLLVFGLNDGGPPYSSTSRGSIPGIGDETKELTKPGGSVETAHTYGWYLSAMATAARDKGAQVYLLTVTVRNIWTNPNAEFKDAKPVGPLPPNYDPKQDRIERGNANGQFTQWTKEVAEKLRLPVLDLTNLCADKFEKLGRETVDTYFSDHNNTYAQGADVVAAAIVSGLKAFRPSPFVPLLSPKGRAVETANAKYVSGNLIP
jgi:rhamnogalacturonan acetylesterase